MCGIAIAAGKAGSSIDPSLIREMCDRIIHRGPDSGGYHVAGSVAIGMRRLSIIDLHTGDQPIFNEDASLAIVFNGEIYNYRELREGLVSRGHRFKTTSDTEVVLHLYEEKGAAALNDLKGMFGFAVLECATGKLFVARDRLGIKPLYYFDGPAGFYAGSEIKSLLAVPGLDRSVDPVAIDQYFSLLYVPSPRSIFKSIHKLPPGYYLVKEPGKPVRIEKYWQLSSVPRTDRSAESLIEEFRERFDAAVRSHMIADVPLGVFLSGGIDSGALVASMARSGARIQTLTLGFPDEYRDFDERSHAKLVADRYGTEHHEIIVEPDIGETVHILAKAFDEPLADSGAVPNFLVCRAARQTVKVALSGLGGDELSAGYQRYLGNQLAESYRRVPAFLRESIIQKLVLALPEPKKGSQTVDRAKRFVRDAALPWIERYFAFSSPIDRSQRQSLYSADLQGRVQLDSSLDIMRAIAGEHAAADPINQLLCIDLRMYTVDDLLAVADRTSMASSLEVRVPFMDHTLVEFMANVPAGMKLRGNTKKWFLREAFGRDLPAEILNKKKSGFSLPVARWLREDLRGLLEDTISESRLRRDGLFNPVAVERLKQEHYSRSHNRSSILWALLMYHLWADNYAS